MSSIELMLDFYDVPYRGTSGEQAIRCPVHDDRNASASLNADKEVFNCHACGASGSVYDMVMAREGISFASAKQFVEEKTGIGYAGEREAARPSTPVPAGTGYRPRYRKKVQAGGRKRLQL